MTLTPILPQRIDNDYRGHRLALWLLVPVVALKTGIGLGAIFEGRRTVQSANGMPLDSFGFSGAEAVRQRLRGALDLPRRPRAESRLESRELEGRREP